MLKERHKVDFFQGSDLKKIKLKKIFIILGYKELKISIS